MPLLIPADVAGCGDAARKPREGLKQEHSNDESRAEIGSAGTDAFQSVLSGALSRVFNSEIKRSVMLRVLRHVPEIIGDGWGFWAFRPFALEGGTVESEPFPSRILIKPSGQFQRFWLCERELVAAIGYRVGNLAEVFQLGITDLIKKLLKRLKLPSIRPR